MKIKILILLLCIGGFISNSIAQTYISKTAKAFNETVNSAILPQSKRVSYDDAFTTLKSLTYNSTNRNLFAGEYFLHDGMIIQVVVITQKNAIYFKPLSEVQQWSRSMVSGGEDRPINEYFTDYIANYNGLKAYVSYFKDDSNSINFVIQDNLGRYVIDGTIYHKTTEKNKAVNFTSSFLNSLTFK